MYLIIVGAGSIGRPLIEIATTGGHEVVVIDHDADRANLAAEDFDCMVLGDDATDKEVLVEAGAHEADAVICTTGHDPTNIMVCLLAQELEIPMLVSIVHRAEDTGVFSQIGVSAVENPEKLIADHLFRAVSFPTVRDYMRIGEHAEIFEIEVVEAAPIAGLTLAEATERGLLTDDALVVAIERGDEEPQVPRGRSRVDVGDVVVVYSPRGADGELAAAFEPTDD